MGAGGTNPPVGYDLMNDVGIEGYMVDQRGPHYFDIRAEAVYLDRNEAFEQDIDFTIGGVLAVIRRIGRCRSKCRGLRAMHLQFISA